VDNTLLPRFISWISKNPHRPGDESPDDDYQKTIICNIPPKAAVATVTVKKNGEVVYEGTFCTPRSPNGKDGSALDDVEKDNFLAYLHDEMNNVDNFERELQSAGLAYFRTGGAHLSSLVPLTARINPPATVRVGKPALFTATALRPWGAPARTVRYEWQFSNRARFTGGRINPVFTTPGIQTVRLTVRDQFGAKRVLTQQFTVTPATQQ